jgi:hypothetical protein
MIYESEEDRKAEAEIAAACAKQWRVKTAPLKLPKLYVFDFALLRDKLFATFLEAKNRPGLSHGYGDGYYIALWKILNANVYHTVCQLPVLLAVRFSDGTIYWTRLHGIVPNVIWAGRKDRPDDPLAMEPHGVIPWQAFEPLQTSQLRITIAPKDEKDAARIVANVGGLLEGHLYGNADGTL